MNAHIPLRQTIRERHLAPDAAVLEALEAEAPVTAAERAAGGQRAEALITTLREKDGADIFEALLAEYGLSNAEGIALMRLAEALMRVPDSATLDALIEDKLASAEWRAHFGDSPALTVNAATAALSVTGAVLEGDGVLGRLSKRLGQPVIREAVRQAMKRMGDHFVLGESIEQAIARARAQEAKAYTYSYDMLGEAALTAADAQAFFASYAHAIDRLAEAAHSDDVRANPGVSVKLSALHPRYETAQRARVMEELVPRLTALARRARTANMGFNIDAEEAGRLELSLDVIAAALADENLAGWDGFGVVVQAYGKRAGPVIDWLHDLAKRLDRRLMVRLVKGAYWDTEIKRAQVEGLAGFPVFTSKAATDVSFLCCARKLFHAADRLYPQFATHNAHTVAMILEMAGARRDFEFQRLHGMGAALHRRVMEAEDVRCRIYAPVGPHRSLLAYLVRRLLENGANSSFVHQIVDPESPVAQIAADPFESPSLRRPSPVRSAAELFAPERVNSRGFDLEDAGALATLDAARAPFADACWSAAPITAVSVPTEPARPVTNPARPEDEVGEAHWTTADGARAAIGAARRWDAPVAERADALRKAADLYEARHAELFALLAREAGKTPADAVAELREAVDFLRYYAVEAERLDAPARGVFACISPWNFPLAIFTGQIAAALAAGNGVVAKPAEATPLIAARATALLHEAGVPAHALQLLPGAGAEVGAALVSDRRIDGVAFTGSTATAQRINRAMAEHLDPAAPLIAETGGLNAMIVDATALPEQAVRDIVISAFQSAGQRCSALRMLYVQEEAYDRVTEMLFGAMDELALGDPWRHATDVGPVIDAEAQAGIRAHIQAARAEGRVLHSVAAPETGSFVAPTAVAVDGIGDLEREVFGPVLHIARFPADGLDAVIDAVNASGYGLTFGLHSRIDARARRIADRVRAGNLYVNRNQIGAIVGSQPFGGEGLSGTGPKAGGPHYLPRFTQPKPPAPIATPDGPVADISAVAEALAAARPAEGALDRMVLPGPTGEANELYLFGRGVALCLGPTRAAAEEQAATARAAGAGAVIVAPSATGPGAVDGVLAPEALAGLEGFDLVITAGDEAAARGYRRALAMRDGPILPLVTSDIAARCRFERHLCIDTAAAGGDAALLGAVA